MTGETFLRHVDCIRDHSVAVIDDAEILTYGELRDRAKGIATALRDTYGREQFVILKGHSTCSFVSTLLGIMYSGNTPIPIAPDLPGPAVDFIKQKSGAVAVIDTLSTGYLDAHAPTNSCPDRDPALVLFTSGTTGFPKGVLISNANLLHSCRTIAGYLNYLEYRSAAVVLPLYYSYALISQVCSQLLVGGRVRLFSDIRNPFKCAQTINELQLETFCGVPATYRALCALHGVSPFCMPTIRVLCSAGAPIARSDVADIRRMFPNARFFDNYGMTEAAPRIAFIQDTDPRFPEGTCGRAMAGVEVKVVHPETFERLPDGEQGVLVVRGPNITSGYLNDPALTAKAFTPDGYLISGDAAYLDQGYIFICGRYDDVFNAGGEKIAPLEIERVLCSVDAVEMAVVVGMPDQERGTVPAAFVKLRQRASRRDLLVRLLENLPKSKVPQRYFEVSGFPMTSSGKLQRNRLKPDGCEFVIREIV